MKFFVNDLCGNTLILFPLLSKQNNDILKIKELVKGVLKYGNLNRYSHVLFDCVDKGQDEIAVFLIEQGVDTTIYKQVHFKKRNRDTISTLFDRQFAMNDCDENEESIFCNNRNDVK